MLSSLIEGHTRILMDEVLDNREFTLYTVVLLHVLVFDLS